SLSLPAVATDYADSPYQVPGRNRYLGIFWFVVQLLSEPPVSRRKGCPSCAAPAARHARPARDGNRVPDAEKTQATSADVASRPLYSGAAAASCTRLRPSSLA